MKNFAVELNTRELFIKVKAIDVSILRDFFKNSGRFLCYNFNACDKFAMFVVYLYRF